MSSRQYWLRYLSIVWGPFRASLVQILIFMIINLLTEIFYHITCGFSFNFSFIFETNITLWPSLVSSTDDILLSQPSQY